MFRSPGGPHLVMAWTPLQAREVPSVPFSRAPAFLAWGGDIVSLLGLWSGLLGETPELRVTSFTWLSGALTHNPCSFRHILFLNFTPNVSPFSK